MVWWIFLGTLAAWGMLCALWTAFGWLLPDCEDTVLVLVIHSPEHGDMTLLRCRWLRSLGLLPGYPAVVAVGLDPEVRAALARKYTDFDFYSREDIPSCTEVERTKVD